MRKNSLTDTCNSEHGANSVLRKALGYKDTESKLIYNKFFNQINSFLTLCNAIYSTATKLFVVS